MASCVTGESMEASGYESSDDENDKGLSTYERAARARASQGLFETEFCYGGEADLKHLMDKCQKNPGHWKFIHSNDFKLSSLPHDYKDRQLLRAIKTSAELTVKLKVVYTSLNRPEKYPNRDDAYPWCQFKGRNLPQRWGTGWVWKVEEYGERINKNSAPCGCKECQNSDQPAKVWWKVIFMTATHVVFDESESLKTLVRFYSEKSNKFETRIMWGCGMGESSIEADRGMFFCVSHDADFCKRLSTLCLRRKELIEKCDGRYRRDNANGLTVVVSHPHGSDKRISVGSGLNREDQELASSYCYNAATCPGSSGGFIWVVGWGSHHGPVAPHSAGDKDKNSSGWSWHL